MKKIVTILLSAALLLALLVGCSSQALTTDDAKQIALKDLGLTEAQVSDVHVHIATSDDGAACYSVYLTANGKQMEYLIHGTTGEIIHSGEGSHSH
jgi:uncharacterized membrane protein YkoI